MLLMSVHARDHETRPCLLFNQFYTQQEPKPDHYDKKTFSSTKSTLEDNINI